MGDQGCPPDGTVDGEQPGVRPTCPMACLGPMSLVSPWCARGHRPGLGTRRWHVSLRGQEAQVCPQVDAPALTPLLLPTQPSPGPQGVAGIVECAQATVAAPSHGGHPTHSPPRPRQPVTVFAKGPSCWPQGPPPLERRASCCVAPHGPQQAGNLLLFVEYFCHANQRASPGAML